MQAQFRHPLYVGMMLVLACVIVALRPYDHLLNFAALRMTIFYAVCFSSFTASLYLALYLCHRFGWRAYSLFTVGFAGLASTLAGLIAALMLGAPLPTAADMMLVTAFNLVFCYLGEMILSTYIIPRIIADLRGRPSRDVLAEFIASELGSLSQPTPAAPPQPPTAPPLPQAQLAPKDRVTIFGHSFAAASILVIEAEEHYVAICLSDGSRHLLRGRIADAIAALPPHLGRQVHRSFWVATSALRGCVAENSSLQLILINGQTIPVARQRIASIRAWADPIIGTPDRKKAPRGVPS